MAGLVALCLLVAVPDAGAAGVHVEEVGGYPTVAPETSTLIFEAAPGEQNDLSIGITAQTPAEVTYALTDASSAVNAGAGCSGGGTPGTEVVCRLQTSRPQSCVRTFCIDHGRRVSLRMLLGDRNDSLTATTLPGDDGGDGIFGTNTAAGEGDDTFTGGASADVIEPGPGADTIASGEGEDQLVAAPSAGDGAADVFDLGPGVDGIRYTGVQAAVSISSDGTANDGTAGDGDNVLLAEVLAGGDADDELSGADQPPSASEPEFLSGGPGDDLIAGNGGNDVINGDVGSDRISGGAGADSVYEYGSEPNVIAGGAGGDNIFGARKRDRISGGAGDDEINGFQGADILHGGPGRDLIGTWKGDHDRDAVDCGPARDRANVDPEDSARRCEQVL